MSPFVVECIKRKWNDKISDLRQGERYLDVSNQVQHMFRKNRLGMLLTSQDYWYLPIVDVTSIKQTSLLEWGGLSRFEAKDGEEWNVVMYNKLGQSSDGRTMYLAAIVGMVPCVMYLEQGGEDELADHHSLNS